MYEQTLTGDVYIVRVKVWASRHRGSASESDHYGADYEYTYYLVAGKVCIYDKNTGRPIFAFDLANPDTFSSEPSDVVLKGYVETEDLLPDRQEAYADWLAEHWIECFSKFDPSKGILKIVLTEPDRAELVQKGFIADKNGQASLPLYDMQAAGR
jgi:hypothetical protein